MKEADHAEKKKTREIEWLAWAKVMGEQSETASPGTSSVVLVFLQN